MSRALVILFLVIAVMGQARLSEAEKAAQNLIPVKPAYAEEEESAASRTALPKGPAPADQMYLFWYLGKVLSFPADVAEAVFTGLKDRVKAVPASAPPQSNPFENRNWSVIPPAPPVSPGNDDHR